MLSGFNPDRLSLPVAMSAPVQAVSVSLCFSRLFRWLAIFWCKHTPNTAVKGTRGLDAVLKVCFLIEFGGFAKCPLAARSIPLRWQT